MRRESDDKQYHNHQKRDRERCRERFVPIACHPRILLRRATKMTPPDFSDGILCFVPHATRSFRLQTRSVRCRLLDKKSHGANTYYVPTALLLDAWSKSGKLTAQGGKSVAQSGKAAVQSGKLTNEPSDLEDETETLELPDEVSSRLPEISRRSAPEVIQKAILELCNWKPLNAIEIASYLGRKSHKRLLEDHIAPLVDSGHLSRVFPENPTHPAQRYKTTPTGLQWII